MGIKEAPVGRRTRRRCHEFFAMQNHAASGKIKIEAKDMRSC
jgi:hypothetical protein